jgi:AcrR family transcriptional regulator
MTHAPTHRQRPYHHGNLRQALIDMAVQVAEEQGHEELSLREVARRLGVSSGAPFRHFPNRASLMAAIAEEATMRLRIGVERDLRKAGPDEVTQLKVLGRAFIAWALDKPAQFRIVSARRLFDFEASPRLQTHFNEVRDITLRLVEQAQNAGLLSAKLSSADLALSLRATAYGLARMCVDGQLPQWKVASRAQTAHVLALMDATVDAMVGQGLQVNKATPLTCANTDCPATRPKRSTDRRVTRANK